MSKGKKKKKGRRAVRAELEAQIITMSTMIVDLEGQLAGAKTDLDQLVADWREVNDEAIGL